jgi:O-antigen/teichoic acid export membrane protein
LIWPSVLALAWGWVATGAAYAACSFLSKDARWPRIRWDRDTVRSLSSFGRWACASGWLLIFQQRGDRLVLGKIVAPGELGNFVIASNLALLPLTMFLRINTGVAQPLYARIRDLPRDEMRAKIRRLRLGIMASHVPVLVLMVIFGQPLVDLFYTPEYARAGWYCSLACLAALTRVGTDLGPIFPAYGDSFTHFHITLVRTIVLVLARAVGYAVGAACGSPANGVLYGAILAPILSYPHQAVLYHRIHAWLPEVDLIALIPAFLLLLGHAKGLF